MLEQGSENRIQKWELVELHNTFNRSSVLMAFSRPSEILILGGISEGQKCQGGLVFDIGTR